MSNARVGGGAYRRRAAVAFAVSAVMLAGSAGPIEAKSGGTAPTYMVTSSGIDPHQADALGRALGVAVDGRMNSGAYQFADPRSFLKVPTVPVSPIPGSPGNEDGGRIVSRGIDFDAVASMSSPSGTDALAMVRHGLHAAGISLPDATPVVGHTFFDAFHKDGSVRLHHAIATDVRYRFQTPDGMPLLGPGAQAAFSFDPAGDATLVWLAKSKLSTGPEVPIMSNDQAVSACADGAPPGATMTAKLVYYAPPLSPDVTAILPHYLCRGSAPAGPHHTEQLKNSFIPAMLPGAGGPFQPPSITVMADSSGATVNAQADVNGGTPPYTFTWGSEDTATPPGDTGPSISYDVTSRDAATAGDVVHVRVTDANGLTADDSKAVSLSGVGVQPQPPPEPAKRTTGIEEQSWTANLGGNSEATANAFAAGVNAAVPGVNLEFFEAEEWSWETDFLSDVFAHGMDGFYADNVDMTYYTAHGFPGGFTFTIAHDSKVITAFDMRLGDRDAEWLALDSCLFLNNDDNFVINRIQYMFTGLHSVLGFQTTSDNQTILGGIFADDMFGGSSSPYSHTFGAHLTVVQSWALAAIISNGDKNAWAAMGPYATGGLSDVTDHFWGFGPTGPDIKRVNIKGYWRLSGPT